MRRMFFSHSCGFMEEMLHASASSQSCSLYINAELIETNSRLIDSLLRLRGEKKKKKPCNLHTSSVNSYNCVTIKCTPLWNFINTLSHISFRPIFHFDGSLCLTKPHGV